MYSRKKGRSGSTRPAQLKASWVKHKQKEIDELVVKLAKQGNQASRIGLILRDQYGIPTVKINKTRMKKILIDQKLAPEFPDDLFNLLRKAVSLHAHMAKNKKDSTSKRGLELTESKIRRLGKFHIREGSLPQGWKYNIDNARLLVK